MVFKFYKAQVTGIGYMPQGDCQATLELDAARNPSWSDMTDEFREFCLPWFSNTVRMGIFDNPEPFKAYSDEALAHLEKHQLPSVGFMMVKISGGPEASKQAPPEKKPEAPKPPPPAFPNVGFSPPAHLFKKNSG